MIKRDTASGQNRLYGVRTWEELDLEKPNRDFYNDDDIKRMVLAEENNATKDDFDHGALYTMDGELIDQNTGKLGSLDHPRMISRIEVSFVDFACFVLCNCLFVLPGLNMKR